MRKDGSVSERENAGSCRLSEPLKELVDPAEAAEFDALVEIIERARARVFQAVNAEMLDMCWRSGRDRGGEG